MNQETAMNQEKYGLLIVNLGTPNAPTPQAVRSYLAKFLSDQRVIDMPRFLWLPLLYGLILPLRSSKLAKCYQKIWLEGGSPLMVYSLRQKKALTDLMPDVAVELAMTYGQPPLSQAIANLCAQNLKRLVILPLFPQYSSTTSAAIWDTVARILTHYRRLPSISFIRDYAQHPAYIAALNASISRTFVKYGKPDRLIISFHGIPIRYTKEGDDYYHRCQTTIKELNAVLDYPAEKVIMTFQSYFGRDSWLLPAIDEIMKLLPTQGVHHVQVICPGFAADCLETLEEIQIKNCKIFKNSGGKIFHYIPALNDDAAHITLLYQLITEELK